MLKAKRKDRAIIHEMDLVADDSNLFHIWWLGQSGFLIQWKRKRILIDPYLSDSLTKKYAATNKPHIRMSERVVDPHFLKGISIITSSHNHTDHLDAETLIPIIANNSEAALVIPESNRQFVSDRLQVSNEIPTGLTDGKSISIDEVKISGVPAAHNEIERDDSGNCKFMGYVFQFGSWTVYHSGDTLWYEEMVDILSPFKIDVALLPINGNDPARGVAGNLNSEEAARLGKEIGARLVIPCHYDMFTFNTADPADFATEAERLGQPYKILEGGDCFTSEEL